MNGTEIYAECADENPSSAEALLTCITDVLLQQTTADKEAIKRNSEYSRNLYIMIAAALAFFMQAGFAMVCAGAVRKKNLQNTMLKNLLDACGASVAFYAIGYAIAFGDGPNPNAFIGTRNLFLSGVDDIAFWLFQYAFSAASATIVAGTLAERCQMTAYFYYTILLSGFVYPVTAHVIWSPYGLLSASNADPLFGVGVVDVAGGGVVHVTGGTTALVATWILGPRRGRFHDEQTGEPLDTPKVIKGHNIGLQLLGTLILWFGWYGFNTGSALLLGTEETSDIIAALAAANTTLAAGCAGVSALFGNYVVQRRLDGEGKYDLVLAMNGVLSGLVAITAGCGVVETWAAVIIGCFAGLFFIFTSWGLIRLRLDDAVDAIPVHMVNGIWGILATGCFASPSRLQQAYGHGNHAGFFFLGDGGLDLTLFEAQIIGLLFIVGWTVFTMLPFFVFLEWRGSFRATAMDEVLGLDRAYFGGLQMGGEDEITSEQIVKLTKQLETQIESRRRSMHHHGKHENSNNSNSNGESKEAAGDSAV